jgi:HSP20 family molecular chaperone IbpA
MVDKRAKLYVNQLMDLADEFFGTGISRTIDSLVFSNRCKMFYPNRVPMDHILKEDGTNVFIIAACGLDKDDIMIETEDNTLSISAKVKDDNAIPNKDIVLQHSLVFGGIKPFTIILNDTSDVAKVTVELKQGLLYITIPVKPAKKVDKKTITVQ